MRTFFTSLIILLTFPLFGQQPAPHTVPVKDVDQLILPKQDNDALREAELQRRGPGTAPQFAIPLEVQVTPESHGTWEITRDNQAVWRLYVKSPGARSLNFGFTRFVMPSSGQLLIYTPNLARVLGPFTPADNEEHEQLWTPVIEGDELVIEVQIDPNQIDQLQLELKSVNHDYLGFHDMSSLLSGSCNLDVICGEDDGWGIVDDYRDIIQSVAVISTGGSTFCTGFLVNNAEQDCTPYFMTAFHCGINAGNAPSLVAYWNYQNSFCRQPDSPASGQPGDGQLNDFNTGSTFRAGYSPSDFVLVEFDDPLSETADGFFAGWSAEDVAPTSSIAVHHPSTDEKRISFETDPGTLTTYLSDTPTSNYTHVRVEDWDIGTTEPGSSGSPLFDQNKRVIGQLHGGFAACSNNLEDWYGSFHVSWEGGGTPSTRLKDWLDPNNTGTLTLDGRAQAACSFFVGINPFNDLCAGDNLTLDLEVGEAFAGPVTLTTSNVPPGVQVSFAANPIAPGGMTTVSIQNTDGLATGEYTFTVTGTDGTDNAESEVFLNVYAGLPPVPDDIFPTDGTNDAGITIELEWSASPNAQEYAYEVALDPDFNNILVAQSELSGTTASLPILDPSTDYYWHVRSTNACGQSDWSDTYSFITANITCNNVFPGDLPIPISDEGTPTITSTIEIPFAGEILDLNVLNLAGLHTYLDDLIFELTSPEGTTVTLVSSICGSQNNFDISFDDQALSGNIPCPYNDGGTYQPLQSLALFNGENPQGTWTLTVFDTFNDDGGVLQSWSLDICIEESAFVTFDPAVLSGCAGETLSTTMLASSGFTGPVTVNVSAPSGADVTVTPNPVQPGQTAVIEVSDAGIGAGQYNLTVEATDGTETATQTISMTLEGLPDPADLTEPAPAALNIPVNTTFTWTEVPEADTYLFELNESPDFTDPLISEEVTTNSFSPAQQLDFETEYFWRVSSLSPCGSNSSATESFTTEFLESTTSIEGIRFDLSPVPTTGDLLIAFSAALPHDLDVSVYTVDGRELQRTRIDSGNQQLNLQLADYPAGVYLVRLYNQFGSSTQRVVLID